MPPLERRGIRRVVIDESMTATPEILDEAARRIGGWPAEAVVLSESHPGLPDVVILDRLMDTRSLLVTADRVLHGRALARGFASLLRMPETGWTEKPVVDVAAPAQLPPALLEEDAHVPHRSERAMAIAGVLNGFRSEREHKQFRTKRRRIRAHFETPANIGAVALTIGQRRTPGGRIGGYKLKVDGRHGVKALFPASEGYFIDTASPAHPLLATAWAMVQLWGLHLEGRRLSLYHLDPAACESCSALAAKPASARDPLEKGLALLLAEAERVEVLPCAKGRFHDQMAAKLVQVVSPNSNELVRVDIRALATALTEVDGG